MTRRLWFVSGSASALFAIALGFAIALWHTPTFYAETRREDVRSELREQQSKEFVQHATQLDGEIRNDDRWSGEFSQDQINGFLAYDLPTRFARWLPGKVDEPRVRLSAGEIDVAFRYRRGWWHGTVHSQVRPRVLSPNQIALEIRTIRAGAIPIPVAQPLDEIVAEMRKAGWQVQWKPTRSGDVLVIELQPDIASRVSLDGLEIQPGVLRFAGHKPHSVAVKSAAQTTSETTAAKPGRSRR
jgi:hypothetical protein